MTDTTDSQMMERQRCHPYRSLLKGRPPIVTMSLHSSLQYSSSASNGIGGDHLDCVDKSCGSFHKKRSLVSSDNAADVDDEDAEGAQMPMRRGHWQSPTIWQQ